MTDVTAFPDPESIPDLTQFRRPRTPPRIATTGDRRSRRVEEAMIRAEERVRGAGSRPLVVIEARPIPHVRLGLAWAAVTLGAAYAGRPLLAVWLAAASAITAAQIARAWRRTTGARPLPFVAIAVAAACPLAALAGGGVSGITAVAVAAIPLALAGRLLLVTSESLGKPTRDVALTLLAALPVGIAAASVVLIRSLGRSEALVFLAAVMAYDVGSYLVGSGASNVWEGPAAGAACTLPVTLFLAAGLVHPFTGSSPWVLGLVVAVGAPTGQLIAEVLTPDAPGLRRLDSLVASAPIWAWAALALLR